jgi:hypothetical protein
MNCTMKRDLDLQGVLEVLNQVRAALLDEVRRAGQDNDYGRSKALLEAAEMAHVLSSKVDVLVQRPAASSTALGTAAARVPSREYLFVLRDGDLVKKGRSRDGSATYEHTVPKAVRLGITDVIARWEGKELTSDQLQEEVVELIGCPAYQFYAVLALLRQKGMVVSERKGHYKIPAHFGAEVRKLWREMEVTL